MCSTEGPASISSSTTTRRERSSRASHRAARPAGAPTGCAPVEDLHGSQKGDVLVGNGGNNSISGHCGADRIIGGGGNDVVAGDDCPVGAGLPGSDRMYGGPGRDRLNGGPKKDYADGGSGRDVCRAENKKRCP